MVNVSNNFCSLFLQFKKKHGNVNRIYARFQCEKKRFAEFYVYQQQTTNKNKKTFLIHLIYGWKIDKRNDICAFGPVIPNGIFWPPLFGKNETKTSTIQIKCTQH